MDDARLRLLLDIGDVDALIEYVQSLSLDARWDQLVHLRDGCRAALERGHQLWPAAAYAEYRLALDAPVAYACGVLGSASERFAFGPFTEVVAERFGWDVLCNNLLNLDAPTIAALAQERVLRGDDLSIDPLALATAAVFELPLARAAWEPAAQPVVYLAERAEFPAPRRPLFVPGVAGRHGDVIDDEPVTDALCALVRVWQSSPRAHIRALAVEGTALDAVGALGCTDVGWAEVALSDGLAWCSWAAASGGSRSRRRGGAAARSDVWWLAHTLTDSLEDPLDAERLARRLEDMRAYVFDDGSPHVGWLLRVAFADECEGLAWVVAASDAADPVEHATST